MLWKSHSEEIITKRVGKFKGWVEGIKKAIDQCQRKFAGIYFKESYAFPYSAHLIKSQDVNLWLIPLGVTFALAHTTI